MSDERTAAVSIRLPADASAARGRVAAIFGRPNVGKSAVFNRIAGRRLAIVHNQSGVTRDRLMCEVTWQDQRFSLVDTGGITSTAPGPSRDPIEAGVRMQVDAALADAALAILVVDVQAGLNPMDIEAARLIRHSGLPCLVAVNKCDDPRHEAGMADFARLGYPLFAVSAEHNRGFDLFMAGVLQGLPNSVNETVANPLRVAVVGRPNAGKSSYINRLLKDERVIVSDLPGTTRDSIEVPFVIGHGLQARHYTLIDTAGMRQVHKVDSAVERFSLFRAERSIADADIVVLIMDASIGPTSQDKHIAARIQRLRKGCVLVVNKWDLSRADGITETRAEPTLRAMLPFMNYCPLIFISALEGYNVRRSIDLIDLVAAQVRARIPTGILNRTLIEAVHRAPPPMVGGKRLRVYYVLQVGMAPIALRLFVNDPRLAVRPFTDFLVRSVRERFGLEGAPVVISYRARARSERHAGKPSAPVRSRRGN